MKKTLNNNIKENNNILSLKSNETHKIVEIGGPQGPEPTRYGDWEKNGRATDF